MNQRSDEAQQKLVAGLMFAGVLLIGLCVLLIVLAPHPVLVMINVVGIVLGLVLMLVGVFSGLAFERASHKTAPRVEHNCRVMARYGVNHLNEVLSSDWAMDSDDFRPHVRLHSPQSGAMEFECAMPVWQQCGEGMLGDAVIQGRWLSQFTPARGMPAPPPGQI